MNNKITVFDSTLRDGAQSEGVSYSVQDKLNIAKALDGFGVSYIEAGIPGANPKDMEFFEKASKLSFKNAKLCAFGRTAPKGTAPQDDPGLAAIVGSGCPAAAIFGKAWSLHVTEILGITPEENLETVENSVRFLKSHGMEVIFDAEHAFDGFKDDRAYAENVICAAISGGADCISLCDTNGGTMPFEIYDITKKLCERFSETVFAIHAHDDCGCAAANSVMAIRAGASSVQGTFIGYGERAGNAALSTVIPDLVLKCGIECDGSLPLLSKTARTVAEISNMRLGRGMPYVGRSAFAHKGGMHIDAVKKLTRSFEHVDPETVGNKRRFLNSEMSGRASVLDKVQEFIPDAEKNSPTTKRITEKLKELEYHGYRFEAADASFELMVKRTLGIFKPHFDTILYKTIGEFPGSNGGTQASAMIRISVDGREEITAAIGNGPVNALDTALRKALSVFYPQLRTVHLTDYKVRVFDTEKATGAMTRVMIETSDGSETWTTVGASADIIEASWLALVDSIEYKLSKE